MGKLISRPFLTTVLAIFIFTSCAPLPKSGTALTNEEREAARKNCITRYTAGGALGGGILGGLLGGDKHRLEGAIGGAVVGGTLAFAIAWGHCFSVYSDLKSYPVADATTTARQIGYTPSQGYVTKIKNFSLHPDSVSPGDKVNINGSYYVMSPGGESDIKVTETRIVRFLDPDDSTWKELGSVDQEVTSAPGTRNAEGSFQMPSDVPEGKYRVVFKVSALGKEDELSRDVYVGKGTAGQGKGSRYAGKEDYRLDTEQNGDKSIEYPRDGTVQQERGTTAQVVSKTLNLRREPSTKSDIVSAIKQGEIHEIIEQRTTSKIKWIKLKLRDGTEGWASGKYLRIIE